MPSPDCPTAVRGPQGWISIVRSSSFTAKITAIIGSITSDLRLRHKTYHCVAFQSIYTMLPETSLFDHPRVAIRRSKFQQNHPRALPTISIAPILSPSPLSELSFSDLHSRKIISHIGCLMCPHTPPKIHCNISYASHALHAPPCCPLTSLVDVICHISPSYSLADVTYWCHHLVNTQSTLTSAFVDSWPLTWQGIDRWLWHRVDFCSPGAPYPVFRVDFIFAVYFYIFFLLNEE